MKASIINQFSEAIKLAAAAAKSADQLVTPDQQKDFITNDGGTCNFDTPVIDFKGWDQSSLNEVMELSGIKIGEKLNGYHKGCRFVWVPLNGQAANRTRMAEAAYQKLKELGIPAGVWYHMD